MTLRQAAALYFEGKHEPAKKRIQKLKKAGFIAERARRVSEPAILSLTVAACQYLAKNQFLADYPKLPLTFPGGRREVSDLTVHHELQVMDVKASVAVAIRNTDRYNLAEFATWPRLNEFFAARPTGKYGQTKVLVKPDGFIRIEKYEPDGWVQEYTFFLEVDRSTETLETLAVRAACYGDYFRSGGFAVRNGQSKDAYKEFPFRLLIVCKTAERRNNTIERLLHLRPPILTMAWLTTTEEMVNNPLGQIWVRPMDYRDAAHTQTDIVPKSFSMPYRRDQNRENLIEKTVSKKCIFDT
jgi:hypothetical protein